MKKLLNVICFGALIIGCGGKTEETDLGKLSQDKRFQKKISELSSEEAKEAKTLLVKHLGGNDIDSCLSTANVLQDQACRDAVDLCKNPTADSTQKLADLQQKNEKFIDKIITSCIDIAMNKILAYYAQYNKLIKEAATLDCDTSKQSDFAKKVSEFDVSNKELKADINACAN